MKQVACNVYESKYVYILMKQPLRMGEYDIKNETQT